MTTTHEFPVPIADLDAGGRELKFPVRAAWIRGALDVRVSKSGSDVVVRGQLKADLQMPCARCLKEVSLHLEHPVTALMVPAVDLHTSRGRSGKDGKDDESEEEIAAEELDVVPYSGETIALDDLVRDELVLEIPMI